MAYRGYSSDNTIPEIERRQRDSMTISSEALLRALLTHHPRIVARLTREK
jgi:hypothetical protein